MRYHYEKPKVYFSMYGKLYHCDHPVYNSCTLYKIGNRGLAVIQQRYDPLTKNTWWTNIDPWLTDDIYLHPAFKDFFDSRAGEIDDKNLYPTVTVRQIMWAMRMKPISKQPWETVFDRRNV